MRFGAHVRTTGGLITAIERGEQRDCEVVQVFTQSPRMWRATACTEDDFAAFRGRMAASPRVTGSVCHAIYLINLAGPDGAIWERSRDALVTNLRIAAGIGAEGCIVHVGSHVGTGLEAGVDRAAAALSFALDAVPSATPILLENTAGAGGTIGRTFEELARIVDRLDAHPRVGLCLDTQHLWASGVPFTTADEVDDIVATVDGALGLDRLRCLHVNDSLVELGSNRDRHANLGEGTIGEASLGLLLGHPALQGLPAILEVPGPEDDGATAADLAIARRLHAAGRAAHAERAAAGL